MDAPESRTCPYCCQVLDTPTARHSFPYFCSYLFPAGEAAAKAKAPSGSTDQQEPRQEACF